MEMDVVQVNHNWDCIEDESGQKSIPVEAPGIWDSCRDPELLPRVGDQYQVEIPPLMEKSSYLLLTERPTDAAILSGTSHDFLVGLPISLMWISDYGESIKLEKQEVFGDLTGMPNKTKSVKSESRRKMQIFLEAGLKSNVEPMDVTFGCGMEVGKSSNLHLQQEMKNVIHQIPYGGKGYCMVPGAVDNTWCYLEEASFLLGLYIFGKNLIQLKKFVESKNMGDILAYYYGKFYRSDRYFRWTHCRKIKSRRCIYGQRIFTGSRHQELLSRLLQQVSQECQDAFLEVAKSFGEGKMLLEDYVLTLKATVGLNALVEAVGIGKGKQDLTSFAFETPKSSQAAPARPEIPIGKACSMLTPLEIINFLTGGYRLSKARSSDLFWEAVWPRLLARGWHSEQPNDYSFSAASRQSLVFLIPGIKKFSRRKLVKGDHYFDSVSDVLNKVAMNPELLELDDGVDNKEENSSSAETNLEQGDSPDQQRHCYLKPRNPSHNANAVNFTIVDTSLANGKRAKVRELRSLPIGMKNISASRVDSDELDGNFSEDPTDDSDYADNLHFDGNKTSVSKSTKLNFDEAISSDKEYPKDTAAELCLPINGPCFSRVSVKVPMDHKADECSDMQPIKTIKGQMIQRTKPIDGVPVAKRQQRLTACDILGTSHSNLFVGPMIKQDEAGFDAISSNFNGNIFSHMDPHQETLSSTSCSSWGSPNFGDEWTLSCSSYSSLHPQEIPPSRTLIDLNIPIPQDAENELVELKMTESHHDQPSKLPEDPHNLLTSKSVCDSTSEQPSNMNARRHSTRNRPPTTKALEAHACGFLSVKQKRKGRDDFSLQSSIQRPSQRARGKLRMAENISTGTIDFKGDNAGNFVGKSDGDALSELQV